MGLAPSNHGTTLNGLFTLAGYFPGSDAFLADCPACQEQEAGSQFITDLNAGGETNPDVNYTVIESVNDEVVTPNTSAFLARAPGVDNVKNITLQHQCPLDQGEHLSMPYDHIADADVLSALDPAHPQHPLCTPVLPSRADDRGAAPRCPASAVVGGDHSQRQAGQYQPHDHDHE